MKEKRDQLKIDLGIVLTHNMLKRGTAKWKDAIHYFWSGYLYSLPEGSIDAYVQMCIASGRYEDLVTYDGD